VTRVAHLITRLIVGGAQENTIQSVAGLRATGRFEVDLITGPTFGPEGSLVHEAKRLGITPMLVRTLRREVNPLFDPVALLTLVGIFRRRRYTIVHTHSSKAGVLGRAAARIAGVPVVVHSAHGWGHHDRQHSLIRRLYIGIERLSAAGTDAIAAVSGASAERGLREGIGRPGQYVVIRSAVDTPRYGKSFRRRDEIRRELGIDDAAVVVGTVGRLSPPKAPELFVEAAAKVLREAPNACFVSVGDGPLRDRARRRAERLGVGARFQFLGLRLDVPELLGAFDIFVLPSLWEGLPRVIPQAMAAGLPVVATDVGGNVEAVEPGVNGLLVPPGDATAVAEAVLQLIRDPETARQMGEKGRDRAKEFDLQHMLRQLEALYDRLLSEKGIVTAP
jgi:glycosyltransferase involved in cell wall biosynthesis